MKKETNLKNHTHTWQEENTKIRSYESVFYMDGVEKPLRYIKIAKKNENGNRTQVLLTTTSMTISTETIYRIMKSRWDIENSVFNNLKNNANLNHCFVHGGNAAEAVLYLIFIANNLFQLFKLRRLKNHVSNQIELVRLLLKGLYLVDRKDMIILNSA